MIDDKLILIIDDDLVQNEIHALIIKKIEPEASVISFTNSEKALNFLQKGNKPDVIFLDLNIPGDTISNFLNEHRSCGAPGDIYLMSAAHYLDDNAAFTTFPAVKDFISKPLLAHKLKHALNTYA